MHWVYMFVFGSSTRSWFGNTKKHSSLQSVDRSIDQERKDSVESDRIQIGKHVFLLPEISRWNVTKSYLNSDNQTPIADFNVSLETIHKHMNYYHLLTLLLSKDLSNVQKLQHIGTNDITKECIVSSIAPQLTKNLISDW